jgi:amidase
MAHLLIVECGVKHRDRYPTWIPLFRGCSRGSFVFQSITFLTATASFKTANCLYVTLRIMGSVATCWEAKTLGVRQILQDSLNPDWLLPADKLPPKSQKNVSTFIETSGALTSRELEITAKTAVALVADMAAGSLSAVETVTAFLKRAHVAHQLTNFATEFMVKDALEAARELDEYFAATGKLVGPLHGLPISTKEHIGLKGRIVHSGYVAWTNNVVEEDALIVKLAKRAGAVFHVRTNVPQIVMVGPERIPRISRVALSD